MQSQLKIKPSNEAELAVQPIQQKTDKFPQDPQQKIEIPKSATQDKVMPGCGLRIAVAIMLIVVGVQLGSNVSLLLFSGVALLCVLGCIAFNRDGKYRGEIYILTACFSISAGFASSGFQSRETWRIEHAAAAARNAVARAEHKKKALRNHLLREAWNRAHPAEAAKRRAAEKKELADREIRARRTSSIQNAQQAEEDRISAIPYATRLGHAKTEFVRLAGNRGLFASAVILQTYIKDDRFILMIDNAEWNSSSDAVKDGFRTSAEENWRKSCSENFACDPNDIHSSNIDQSLNYQFTSYFDSHLRYRCVTA